MKSLVHTLKIEFYCQQPYHKYKMLQNWLKKAKFPAPPPGLPDPNQIKDESIAEEQQVINQEIAATTPARNSRKGKRGNYNNYDDETRCKIAKYALLHGNTAAVRHFSKELDIKIYEASVRNMRKQLTASLKSKQNQSVTKLSTNKSGRPLILGDDLDHRVQTALQRIRQDGGTINRHIVIATGTAIVRHHQPSLLKEHGRSVLLTLTCSESLMECMYRERPPKLLDPYLRISTNRKVTT